MSTTVTYKGNTLATVENATKTLKTAGKYMEGDVVITDVTQGGSVVVTEETDPTTGGIIKHITSSSVIVSGSTTITENGTYDVVQYASAIVDVAGGGGLVSVPEKDVNFYDYDGTCVAAYSASEFAALSALPKNPTHDGLTAQGWNWTLANAKAHVAEYGWLHIGQLYITDDGKTRIYINIPSDAPSAFMLFSIRFRQTTSRGVSVDWGDGTVETYTTTSAANHDHTYSGGGNYIITLEVVSGDLYLDTNSGNTITGSANSGTRYKCSYVTKIEVGNAKSIGASCFAQCKGMESVSIPSGISFPDTTNVFSGCGLLRFVALPSTVGSIGAGMFSNCSSITAVGVPKEATDLGATAFQACGSLKRVLIPDGTTAIGNNTFNNNSAIQIIQMPSTVTSIGTTVFTNNFTTMEYHIKATTPPTLANTNAFTGITANCKIYVPTASLDAYKAATNWSTYASKMVGE